MHPSGNQNQPRVSVPFATFFLRPKKCFGSAHAPSIAINVLFSAASSRGRFGRCDEKSNRGKTKPGMGDDRSGLFESDHGISLGPCEFEKGVQELDVAGTLGNGTTGEHAELCRLHDRGG